MKPVEDVVACVVDYGTFVSVAEKLGETMGTVYYSSPTDTEYLDVRDCVIGAGLDNVQRLDDPLDPGTLNQIDLFVFPDIGFSGLQRHLRSLGKAVWGHMGATDLELYRTLFLEVLEAVGLPMINSEQIEGVTALETYLRDKENKWVKINRFRGNVETFKWRNYDESIGIIYNLRVIFGGTAEQVMFVVQDQIESEFEVGYDGWNIDGKFPSASFQGHELKNELYLGSVLAKAELPAEVTHVNDAMAPVLASYGYRCWWATEIRVKDGIPYFIDPTPRMPGQTGEHQLESIENFADIIWQGANGILIEPEFRWKFAAEATLHYKSDTKDPTISDEWKRLSIPEEIRRWVKLYRHCKIDGVYHFGAKNTDEVGVILGVGDSCEESIDQLKDNLEALKDAPVDADTEGFADLLKSIKEAEEQGLKFGGRIPRPSIVLAD